MVLKWSPGTKEIGLIFLDEKISSIYVIGSTKAATTNILNFLINKGPSKKCANMEGQKIIIVPNTANVACEQVYSPKAKLKIVPTIDGTNPVNAVVEVKDKTSNVLVSPSSPNSYDLKEGTYVISVKKDGYNTPQPKELVVSLSDLLQEKSNTLVFSLTAVITKVKLRVETNTEPGAVITILDKSQITGDDKRTVFELDKGKYSIKVKPKESYYKEKVEENVDVQTDKTVSITYKLEEAIF